jgi:hypothetical protein
VNHEQRTRATNFWVRLSASLVTAASRNPAVSALLTCPVISIAQRPGSPRRGVGRQSRQRRVGGRHSVLIGDRCGDDCGPPAVGDRYASPFPQVLASKLVFEDGLASRSLDNSAYGQWRSAATLGNYSSDGCGYELMTEHWRPYTSDRQRIADRRKRRKGAPPPSSTAKRRHPSVSLTASSSMPLAVS